MSSQNTNFIYIYILQQEKKAVNGCKNYKTEKLFSVLKVCFLAVESLLQNRDKPAPRASNEIREQRARVSMQGGVAEKR